MCESTAQTVEGLQQLSERHKSVRGSTLLPWKMFVHGAVAQTALHK